MTGAECGGRGLLDCILHRAGMVSEDGYLYNVFTALKRWAMMVANPLHGSLLGLGSVEEASGVVPLLNDPLWPEGDLQCPPSVWMEPRFRNSLAVIRAVLELDDVAEKLGASVDPEAPVSVEWPS